MADPSSEPPHKNGGPQFVRSVTVAGTDDASRVGHPAPIKSRAFTTGDAKEMDDEAAAAVDLQIVTGGGQLQRVKRKRVRSPQRVYVQEQKFLNYYTKYDLMRFLPIRLKSVSIGDILEVRKGYATNNLLRAAKRFTFCEKVPESRCFSIIFNHRKFLHKSVDFVARDEHERDAWVVALSHLVGVAQAARIHFNESRWLCEQFQRADVNKNGRLSFEELWRLLRKLNLQISEDYAKAMFRDCDRIESGLADGSLSEKEFLHFFERLTERKELAHILRAHSSAGSESWTVAELQTFLHDVQGYADMDAKKAEQIIDTYETAHQDNPQQKRLGIIGLRRLLQSRWGGCMKIEHDAIFQDMTLPLNNYYCSASHNTYLTGNQIQGDATVEGYINALRRGARLLELDLFDGDHGEPVITHKRTLVTPISLRNALKAIKKYAFEVSPFPVILTIENHLSHVQQRVAAEVFTELLEQALYVKSKSAHKEPLPSPDQLRNKFLLRGKCGSPIDASDSGTDNNNDDGDAEEDEREKKTSGTTEPSFAALIALPSVKMSRNVYDDIKSHPTDGSASISEGKVESLLDACVPLQSYTATRFVKSYPKGLRQDSSNMAPMPSWTLGIQAVAMNMQTSGEHMDLVTGLFRINGRSGYVLKPEVLRQGRDPRSLAEPKLSFEIAIISAQYLPKPEPSKQIIDPFVEVQIHGVAQDQCQRRTATINNNGFNPCWNETFRQTLVCPDLALLRLLVCDYDSDEFVGEYSIPVNSLRQGYSHVRLNTGYGHSVDASASLLIKVTLRQL